MKAVAAIADTFRGDMNPVVVKELRQAVRSKFLPSVMFLFLLALVIVTGYFLFSSAVDKIVAPGSSWRAGTQLFNAIVGFLALACVLVPGYTAKRVASERTAGNFDLLFVTSLTPGAIVRGKFFAGMSVVVLLFSLCAPFAVCAYLLRGIDLTYMLVSFPALLMVVAVLQMGAVMAGSVPGGKALKQISGIGIFLLLFQGVPLFSMIVFGGLGGSFFHLGSDAPYVLAVLGVLASSVILAFYSFAVLLLSSKRSNRFLPLRLTMSCIWLLWAVTGIACLFVSGEAESIFLWVFPSVVLCALMTLVGVSEKDVDNLRIRSGIPKRWAARALAFPYFTGGANGVVWAFFHVVGTVAGVTLTLLLFEWFHSPVSSSTWKTCTSSGIVGLYLLCYCLTASFIDRICVRGRSKVSTPWVIVLYLVAVGLILPSVLDFAVEKKKLAWAPETEYGNLLALTKSDQRRLKANHLTFGGIWLGMLVAAHLPWIVRRMRAFTPPDDATEDHPSEPSGPTAPPPVPVPPAFTAETAASSTPQEVNGGRRPDGDSSSEAEPTDTG